MNILLTRICFDLLKITETQRLGSKMIHSESESELDFSITINSVSDFYSVSESDSSSVFMNLDICFFLYFIFAFL